MSASFRRISIAVVTVLVPAAALACGHDKPRTITTTAGANPPAVTAAQPAAENSAATTAAPVSYQDAEQVYRNGSYGEAADLFQRYTESKPDNVWGQYMLGMAAWRAGDLHRAEQAFDKALEIDSHHEKSLLNSSRVLLDLGRAAEALDRIQLAIEQDSGSAEGLRLLGRAWDQLGETDKAIDAYRAALVRQPDDVWSMNNLGLIYLEQGEPEQALPPLARAVEIRSTAPVFQNNLGIALERTGHPVSAEKAYQAALTADSTYSKAAVSLERVRARADTVDADPIDLGVLAQTFQLDEKMWQEQEATSDRAATEDTVETEVQQVPDSIVVPTDDTVTPPAPPVDTTTPSVRDSLRVSVMY